MNDAPQPRPSLFSPGGTIHLTHSLGLLVWHFQCLMLNIYLRHHAGRRYWSPLAFWFIYPLVTLWIFMTFGLNTKGMLFLWSLAYAIANTLLCVYHRCTIDYEKHSYDSGESHLARFFPSLSEKTIQVYLEPAVLFGFGFLTAGLRNPLSTWFMLGSVGVFLKHHQDHKERHEQIIDALDQRKQASRLNEMIKQEEAPQQQHDESNVVSRPTKK